MVTTRLDTIFLWVGDLDRSTAFYRDQLGLSVGPRHGAWQVLEIPDSDVTFALHGTDEPVESGGSVVIAFRVADLDEATRVLTGFGCDPVDPEPTDTGVARFRTFSDPDGHIFQLIERG